MFESIVPLQQNSKLSVLKIIKDEPRTWMASRQTCVAFSAK